MIDPFLQCNSNEAAITVAKSGHGLTRVLHHQIGPDLLDGNLRTVLEDFEEAPLPIHLISPEGRQAPATVRTFLDLAAARLREHPLLN